MDGKCIAITKKGKQCPYKAKFGTYCGIHDPSADPSAKSSKDSAKPKHKFDGVNLPRLPEKLKEKLGNATDVGIRKIKEQIIQMWLEDGGTYITLCNYKNKIFISQENYTILLGEFNGEEFVLNQIFTTEKVLETKAPEFEHYGSSTSPLVPISLSFYSDFIPEGVKIKDSRVLTPEQIVSFVKLKTFMFDKWKGLGELIQNNKIYLTEKTYNSAHKYITNKIKELNPFKHVNVNYWSNYIMVNIFAIGKEKEAEKPPKGFKKFWVPENPSDPYLKNPNTSADKTKVPLNLEEELKKFFPDKNLKTYLEIVLKDTSLYKINSKADIFKLYSEFHPDKCGDMNDKKAKLCNLFCGRVENIKKLWYYRSNPGSASPVASKKGEELYLQRILNDEI
jgi:hypothetical protein